MRFPSLPVVLYLLSYMYHKVYMPDNTPGITGSKRRVSRLFRLELGPFSRHRSGDLVSGEHRLGCRQRAADVGVRLQFDPGASWGASRI